MIERASKPDAPAGLAVWCEDEAGPFQALPHPGGRGRPKGRPAPRPHEHGRGGTRKILTSLHPAPGPVRGGQPVARCTTMVLHGWLKATFDGSGAARPVAAEPVDPPATRAAGQTWQAGLARRCTWPARSSRRGGCGWWGPTSPATGRPRWGSGAAGTASCRAVHAVRRHTAWLNRAEAVQRLLKRRARDGQPPPSPGEIGAGFEPTARPWNRQPTPFVGSGKRRQRRRQAPAAATATAGNGDGDRRAMGSIGWAAPLLTHDNRCRDQR